MPLFSVLPFQNSQKNGRLVLGEDISIFSMQFAETQAMNGYTHRTWTIPDDNVPILIEAMKKRCAEENHIFEWHKDYEERIKKEADNFRIIFWFDN